MRKVVLLLIMALAVGLMFTGCKKAAYKDSETITDRTAVAMEDEAAKAGERMGDEGVTGEGLRDFGDYVESSTITFGDIYFDFDKFNIRDDAKDTLKQVAAWISQKNAKIIIEGHCDERGTNEYNLGLGDRRANSTKQYLMASGVPSSKIDTVSYGEERPQCTDKNERCWQLNRRAHFVVLVPK